MTECENVLVVSAHADDEAFGMGGTLLRLQDQGCRLTWLIMSQVWTPRWSKEKVKKREADIDRVSKFVGFDDVVRWDFPDNRMDEYPRDDYQAKMIDVLENIRPDTIFSPGPSDWNWEHQIAFETVEASTKPAYTPYVRRIYAFEIPSSTDWGYQSYRKLPRNVYVDISDYVDAKVELCDIYTTEISTYPHPRSADGIRHLAATRGMECGREASEAFYAPRIIYDGTE